MRKYLLHEIEKDDGLSDMNGNKSNNIFSRKTVKTLVHKYAVRRKCTN